MAAFGIVESSMGAVERVEYFAQTCAEAKLT
jgi:hypothetical protein